MSDLWDRMITLDEAKDRIATLEEQLRVTKGAYKTTEKMCDQARQQRNDLEEQLAEAQRNITDLACVRDVLHNERDSLKDEATEARLLYNTLLKRYNALLTQLGK